MHLKKLKLKKKVKKVFIRHFCQVMLKENSVIIIKTLFRGSQLKLK